MKNSRHGRDLVVAMAFLLGANSAAAETVERLEDTLGQPALLVRHEAGPGPVVLYVHGSTFPSGLSVAYKIDNRSWMDDLRSRGFDVWSFDFAGFGGSDRPVEMSATSGPPTISGGPDAVKQLSRVVAHIRTLEPNARVVLLAHSFGTLPAGAFAAAHPDLVRALILFGPVAGRHTPETPYGNSPAFPVTADDQWRSFQSGLPAAQPSLFRRDRFDAWVAAYMATDPDSGTRSPQAVRVPSGPDHDVAMAWSGHFPYDPTQIRVPTLIVRGEWDVVTTDDDVDWYRVRLTGVPGGVRDVKLPHGSHRMHLEDNRQALFDAAGEFISEVSR